MALREAIAPKSLKLLEGALGEVAVVAVRDHAGDQLVSEFGDARSELERGHRPPQLIGFAGGEPGCDDRNLHGLLLEERNAKRPLQDALEFRGRIADGLAAF